MPKGNKKFTLRVRDAIAALYKEKDLSLIPTKSGSLFSPVLRGDKFAWVKVLDSDGLLVGERKIVSGEGAEPDSEVKLIIGVILQSEDATSQTKPNPLGKAAIGHVVNGIWIDLRKAGRKRLDRCYALMILPRGAAAKQQKSFNTAKRNVENAAAMMPDCEVLIVSRGIKSEDLAAEIIKHVRKWFKGRGRPKKKT